MALSAEHQRRLYERVNRLVLLCEDLLRPLPECGVTLHEAVSFLYRDWRSAETAAMARNRRRAAGRRGAGPRPRERDLFDEADARVSDRRERAVSHLLSCTALEWERISP